MNKRNSKLIFFQIRVVHLAVSVQVQLHSNLKQDTVQVQPWGHLQGSDLWLRVWDLHRQGRDPQQHLVQDPPQDLAGLLLEEMVCGLFTKICFQKLWSFEFYITRKLLEFVISSSECDSEWFKHRMMPYILIISPTKEIWGYNEIIRWLRGWWKVVSPRILKSSKSNMLHLIVMKSSRSTYIIYFFWG